MQALANLAARAAAVAITVMIGRGALAQAPPAPIMPPSLPAAHVVDLMTAEGSEALGAQWKVSDVRIVEVPAIPNTATQYKTTYNIEPHAGAANFDDSKWSTIEAKDLRAGRSGGHVAFMWYRAKLTMPAKLGTFDPTDTVAVLHVLVDDYAEVWVNGHVPRRSGYPSPATMQGDNMPNRVVLSTAVKPGDAFQLAIFGVNGPISVAPGNLIWFREAKVQFYK